MDVFCVFRLKCYSIGHNSLVEKVLDKIFLSEENATDYVEKQKNDQPIDDETVFCVETWKAN